MVNLDSDIEGDAQVKRSKSTKEETPASPGTVQSSRRRSNQRPRVTTREFKNYMNTENTWLRSTSTRCNTLRKVHDKQTTRIALLEELETQNCQIVAKISVDQLLRSTRVELAQELRTIEEKRRKATAELRADISAGIRERAAIEQDVEQWYTKEKKVTKRIEGSC